MRVCPFSALVYCRDKHIVGDIVLYRHISSFINHLMVEVAVLEKKETILIYIFSFQLPTTMVLQDGMHYRLVIKAY